MHGVLRHYTVDAKNVNEIVRRVAAEGLTFLKAIPGFVSWGLMDDGHGHMVTYSVYEGKTGDRRVHQESCGMDQGEHRVPGPQPSAGDRG